MSNRGFIYTRTLVAIFVVLSILPLMISVFRYVSLFEFDYNLTNNKLALMDLRRVLLLAYDIQIDDHELSFLYHNENYSLKLINNKLILRPGTQIYLNDIDEVNFYIKNNCLYISYLNTKGKRYEEVIGQAKGIYLNDFFDNNDQYNDTYYNDG